MSIINVAFYYFFIFVEYPNSNDGINLIKYYVIFEQKKRKRKKKQNPLKILILKLNHAQSGSQEFITFVSRIFFFFLL
jgi:hypothetical protein